MIARKPKKQAVSHDTTALPPGGFYFAPGTVEDCSTSSKTDTIARGLLIDHFRRSALERAYLDELGQLPQAIQPSAEEQALALDALREIDRLLGQLSSNARAAFLHNRLDGMGHAEIAERLGVSVSRVRQYLAQGLRQCYIALYGEPL